MKTTKLRLATALTSAVAFAGSLVAVTGPTASAAPQQAVCAGVTKCHRVTTIDVDGDSRADRVGWRQLSDKEVQIRVATADGELVRKQVDVELWFGGGAWGDAAWIDGRGGAELLIGSVMGAHTPQYTMLTYRKGRLVVERAPGGRLVQGRWTIDSALMIAQGWNRDVGERGRITITQREALRKPSGSGFKGHDTTYAWKGGHWTRVGRVARSYPGNKAARKIAGWYVGHLQRWPGLDW